MGKEYKNLTVTHKAKELAVLVYRLSERGPLSRDLALRDQIRRSAVSVASNLAEGEERGTDKDSVRFFCMAKGSVGELRMQTEIATDLGLLDRGDSENLLSQCRILSRMIGRLIQVRGQASPPLPRATSLRERESWP